MGPIHPVWALAAIHPRWGNRYVYIHTHNVHKRERERETVKDCLPGLAFTRPGK